MEKLIQHKIIKFLKGIGAYVVKTIIVNRNGVPDIICCLNGKFIAFEVKDLKGKITPLQEYNIELIKKAGGKAYLVRSVEEVKEVVESI
jgi:Holliday junction resolvase